MEEYALHDIEAITNEIFRIQSILDVLIEKHINYKTNVQKQLDILNDICTKDNSILNVTEAISLLDVQKENRERMYLFDLFQIYGQGQITSSVLQEIAKTLDDDCNKKEQNFQEKMQQLTATKESLLNEIQDVQQLDIVKKKLVFQMVEAQNQYSQNIEAIFEEERKVNDSNFDESTKQEALKVLAANKKINEDSFLVDIAYLKKQIQLLDTEIQSKWKRTKDQLELARLNLKEKPRTNIKVEKLELKIQQIEEKIAALEKRKKSPSQVTHARRKIFKLTEDINQLKTEKAIIELEDQLEQKGLAITADGTFLTSAGNHLTKSEAFEYGFLQNIPVDTLEALIQHVTEKQLISVDSLSLMDMLDTEDIIYLKKHFAKPLTLALAEIGEKLPTDPIHYLAHWLFKYRYNREINQVKARKINVLTKERSKIAQNSLRQIVTEECHATVMDMIMKSKQIVTEKISAAKKTRL